MCSWNLAGAVRRDFGCTDSFVLAFPLGMCCWLVHRDICFTLLSDKAPGRDCVSALLERQLCSSAFEADMGEAVASFAVREGVLPSARVLGSASHWNEVTSLSAD